MPRAVQELQRSSSQGLGKQTGGGREDKVILAKECPAQLWCSVRAPPACGEAEIPRGAAEVTHPSSSACSLPSVYRHSLTSQSPCISYSFS